MRLDPGDGMGFANGGVAIVMHHKSRLNVTIHRPKQETTMAWQKPEATNLRFGFEITMYIANR